MEELIFILHDNGVPDYEISNFLEVILPVSSFFITSPLRYADADMTDFPLLRPTIFTVK